MALTWTPDRPTESGDFWFRQAENKPPETVTVQGDKVTFRSGRTKNIHHVQGEWGGAVTSSAEPMSEYSPSRPKTETRLMKIGSLVLGAILGSLGTLWYEPYFIYVGEEKSPEIVAHIGPTSSKISITVFPIFRNLGLKPGHIETAEFTPRELHQYPDSLKLNHCDQAPISLLQVFSGKTIACNFVFTYDHRKAISDPVWFQVSYYGPGRHEVHTETYSATPKLGKIKG